MENLSDRGFVFPGKSGAFKRKQTEDPDKNLNSKTPEDEFYRRNNDFCTCRLTLRQSEKGMHIGEYFLGNN